MAKNVKNEHYVPRRYLKHFANDKSFYVFDKEKNEVRPGAIDDYASERYFYDVDFQELKADIIKQNPDFVFDMDLIDSKIFISTIHGAKGLEWDFIIIPDMEPYCFPNYPSLCGSCDKFKGRRESEDVCKIIMKNNDEKKILEELSVFYVAVTRVRKDLFFSASKTRYNADCSIKKSKISCLAFYQE